jgi:hypothetical protein
VGFASPPRGGFAFSWTCVVIPYGPEGRNDGQPTRMAHTRGLGPMGQGHALSVGSGRSATFLEPPKGEVRAAPVLKGGAKEDGHTPPKCIIGFLRTLGHEASPLCT